MSTWRVIKIAGEDLEEKTSLLFDDNISDCSISGVSFDIDGTCLCYLQGIVSDELKNKIKALDLELISDSEVEIENWTQSCPELFEVIKFDKISIIPVSDIDQAKTTQLDPQRDILIIPGTGFGTGHHASTKNLIRMLHSAEIAKLKPESVLDAGAGSAILALVCSKLYQSKVDAYENDTMACENAMDNIQINSLENSITVYPQSVHLAAGKYDLIIANLYAELLEMLCSHLVSLANPKSIFLLSGIRADLLPMIKQKYESHHLQTIEEKIEDGWASLLLKNV